MTTRLTVACGLMALLAIFAGAVALWARYRSYPRVEARRRLRESQAYAPLTP